MNAQRVDPNRLDAELRKAGRDCSVAAISNDRRIAWYCAEEDRMRVTVGAQPPSVQIRLPRSVIPTRTEFSPSGRVMAINFEDRSLRIYDTSTGRPTLTSRGHSEPLVRLAFSADDRLLLGIGEVRSHIWTLPKGEHIAVLPPAIAGEAIKAAAFSPDARWLAFVSSARLLLWRCEACGGTDAWLEQVDRRQVARMLSREQLQGYSLDAEGRTNLREHDHDHVRDAAPSAPPPASTTGLKPH
jgi:WD40 repeat protein